MEIVFLLTCYNRKELTIRCLEALHAQMDKHPEHHCQIIICDDNSTDGTVTAVRSAFPDTEIICTAGNNFWCKGMYIAMKKAYARKYQLYFMINDDVLFFDNMLDTMLDSYKRAGEICGIVGTTISQIDGKATYGGRIGEFDLSIILPQNTLQKCGVANWNCFLIPHQVIEQVGLIDKKYAHSFGDFDYSMAMARKNIPLYVANDYIGYCERNGKEGTFRDVSLSRLERLKKMHGKKGIAFFSQLRYYLKNFGVMYGWRAVFSYIKAWKDIALGK